MDRAPLPQRTLTVIEVRTIEPEEKDKKKNRIVQTKAGEKVSKAPENSFLGRQNQLVERQTVNRNKTTSVASATSRQRRNSDQPPKLSSRLLDLSKLGMALPDPKSVSEKEHDPRLARDRSAQDQDYIEGMKESDRTSLNTREFKFYSYFQRIRQKLDQAWIPILKAQLVNYFKSGRRLAEDTDHGTRVLVTLNDRGEVISVQIISDSGIDILDDAAVKAFNQAGPFPNPPKDMVDVNRQVRIPWNLILKT